jgi:hypothetical protein
MPDLIRHPVFLFLDSGVRRNDNTAASRGEWTRKKNSTSANIAWIDGNRGLYW